MSQHVTCTLLTSCIVQAGHHMVMVEKTPDISIQGLSSPSGPRFSANLNCILERVPEQEQLHLDQCHNGKAARLRLRGWPPRQISLDLGSVWRKFSQTAKLEKLQTRTTKSNSTALLQPSSDSSPCVQKGLRGRSWSDPALSSRSWSCLR